MVAVVLGGKVKVLIQVFFIVALVGVEEDFLILVAGGVDKVGVNGRVDGVGGGRDVGYSGRCKREIDWWVRGSDVDSMAEEWRQ